MIYKTKLIGHLLSRVDMKDVTGGFILPPGQGSANCGSSGAVIITCPAGTTVVCKAGVGCECENANGTTASEKCCSGISDCGSRLHAS
jgi:hypothetical protein